MSYKRTRWLVLTSILLLASVIPLHSTVYAAGSVIVDLSGSGPVYSQAVSPRDNQVRVLITTFNNNNVGFDLLDTQTGEAIANGTITDESQQELFATAHAGRDYQLRLRCQELPWNQTKCNAQGNVSWN